MTMMRNNDSDDNNDDHKNHNDCDDHDYVDHNNHDQTFTLDWPECLGWSRSFNNFIGSLHFWVLIEDKVV